MPASDTQFPPTLLIGVGGIGCRLADEIYGRVPAERRPFVAVHGFDTDTNELAIRPNLAGHLTQTSGPWTVGQYLSMRNNDGLSSWFPAESPELRRKTLTNGAGQVRAVSRLAFRAKMGEAGLRGLERELDHLTRARGSQYAQTLRVSVLGSLMGGTGSGIFIQIALYLREVLARRYQIENVLIRGTFVLPDVLLRGADMPASQINNLRANAYAALKELEAISNNARPGDLDEHLRSRVNIELEFRPDQRDQRGNPTAILPSSLVPYNFVSLWDYEAVGVSDGGTASGIGSAGNYLSQVADAAFCQLFLPLGDKQFSIEDNQILDLVRQQSRNRYCSAGVSEVTYPREDITSFCALRWNAQAIDREWCHIDRLYEVHRREYREDLRNGVYREKIPDRVEYFRKQFETEANAATNNRTFRSLASQFWESDGERTPELRRSSRFMAALEDFVSKTVASQADLQDAFSRAELDFERFKRQEHAAEEQYRAEMALEKLRNKVMAFPEEAAWGIVNGVLWQGWDRAEPPLSDPERSRDHVLNRWLLGSAGAEGPAAHPLVIRWLLCDIHHQLRTRLHEESGLVVANARTEIAIRRYDKVFDLHDTDQVETAADNLERALSQNPLARLFKSRFKEWVEQYSEESSNQRQNLMRYANQKLLELVFTKLLEALDPEGDGLLAQYHRFFDSLEGEAERMRRESMELLGKHDAITAADPTRVFASASPQAKESLWEEVQRDSTIGSDDLPRPVCHAVHAALFKNAFQIKWQKRQPDSSADKVFANHVIPWAQAFVSERCQVLNMSVVDAMARDIQLRILGRDTSGRSPTQEEFRETMIAVLDRVNRLATPYLMPREPREPDQFALWGMSPRVRQQLIERNVEGGGDGQALNIRAADPISGFPDTRILRYRVAMGYRAEDFSKFYSGSDRYPAGNYYLAYRERILEVEQGRQITPHLDIRWHHRDFMPDLNEEAARRDEAAVNRGFLLGLVEGLFTIVKEDGQSNWKFVGKDGQSRNVLNVDGTYARNTLHELHRSLGFNPAIIRAALERHTSFQADDRRSWPMLPGKEDSIRSHRFVKGLLADGAARGEPTSKNFLDSLLGFHLGDPADARLTPIARGTLLPMLCDELLEYFRGSLGPDRRNAADDNARKLFADLVSSSYMLQQLEPANREEWLAVARSKGL
jgi:hypothetical protein